MPAHALAAGGLATLLAAPATGLVFDRDWLRDLPSSHDLWSLVETVDPFCIVDRLDFGGLHTGEPGRVGCHGASWTQTSFVVDGLDVTDPDRGGAPLIAPDLLALESVTVDRDRLAASSAGTGTAFSLATRRPSGGWAGTLEGHGTGARLQSEPDSTVVPIARYGSQRHLAALLQGPLVRDRAAFLLSAADTQAERLEPRDSTPLEGADRSMLGQLSMRIRTDDEVRLLTGLQRLRRPFAGRALYADRDLEEIERLGHVQGSWRRGPGPGGFRIAAAYSRGSLRPDVARAPDGVVERLLDGPVPELAPARSVRERWGVEARWLASLGQLGAAPHALELGASLGRATLAARPIAPAGLVGESVDGLAARVWEYGYAGPESRRRASDVAFDATDRISPTRRLELAGGVRFEATDASAAGGDEIRWRTVSPRIAVRWLISEAARLHWLGSYARQRHRLLLRTLAFGDPAAAAGSSYLWRDANGDGRVQPGERGALVARVGPGGPLASIDPDLKPPRTEELLLGLEAVPSSGLVLRFLAIRRAEADLLESVNVGVPIESYRVIGVPDPYVDFVGADDDRILPLHDREPASFGLDRYLLTNPADHDMLHEGFELFAQRTQGRVRLILGAAAYRWEARTGWRGFRSGENDQGLIGELFDDPNADTYARGRVFFDRNYVIKVAGSYRAPADLRLGAAVRYQDGQPFARLVVAPDLRQGPDFVHAVPEGRHRFTYTLTLDVRAEKGFRTGRGRLALVVEAFNLLDAPNSVEEDAVTSPAFRERPALFGQPPRVVRLGARLDF